MRLAVLVYLSCSPSHIVGSHSEQAVSAGTGLQFQYMVIKGPHSRTRSLSFTIIPFFICLPQQPSQWLEDQQEREGATLPSIPSIRNNFSSPNAKRLICRPRLRSHSKVLLHHTPSGEIPTLTMTGSRMTICSWETMSKRKKTHFIHFRCRTLHTALPMEHFQLGQLDLSTETLTTTI